MECQLEKWIEIFRWIRLILVCRQAPNQSAAMPFILQIGTYLRF